MSKQASTDFTGGGGDKKSQRNIFPLSFQDIGKECPLTKVRTRETGGETKNGKNRSVCLRNKLC